MFLTAITTRRRTVTGIAVLTLSLSGCATTGTPTHTAEPTTAAPPTTYQLPTGFQPEGIDTATLDGHRYAFTGSMADGSIYRVDLDTGHGMALTPSAPSPSIGLEIDSQARIFIADGLGGAVNGDSGAGARVIDARTGHLLASYKFSTAPALVNDVTVTEDAAYFTDTINPVIYALPLGKSGALPTLTDSRCCTSRANTTTTPAPPRSTATASPPRPTTRRYYSSNTAPASSTVSTPPPA